MRGPGAERVRDAAARLQFCGAQGPGWRPLPAARPLSPAPTRPATHVAARQHLVGRGRPVAPPHALRRARPAARFLARSRAGAPSPPRDPPGPARPALRPPRSTGGTEIPLSAAGLVRRPSEQLSATYTRAGPRCRPHSRLLTEERKKPARTDAASPQGPDSGVWATGGRRSREVPGSGGTGLALNGRGATAHPGRGREAGSCENRLWSRHCSSVTSGSHPNRQGLFPLLEVGTSNRTDLIGALGSFDERICGTLLLQACDIRRMVDRLDEASVICSLQACLVSKTSDDFKGSDLEELRNTDGSPHRCGGSSLCHNCLGNQAKKFSWRHQNKVPQIPKNYLDEICT
ncbi:uncharacterized protein LOC111744423 [Pteropus vampyrus]|uniref:Uncharacterized protein LOC111744423 n=1 Tax=Pteropus vampyrus TaxID=132908 RepID=A0A6P6CT44_PTEVA|nr:uncharacterized protein LOC111744423 [Pteropus vampyrus]